MLPPAAMEMQKIPDAIVMSNRQMRTNESALAGITVISVPAYNIERGPVPGEFYHPKERGQGYLLTFSDKLEAARDKKARPFMSRATRSACPR